MKELLSLATFKMVKKLFILDKNDSRLSELILSSNSSFKDAENESILNATIQSVFDTKIFHVSL